jgi:hypothetical protein
MRRHPARLASSLVFVAAVTLAALGILAFAPPVADAIAGPSVCTYYSNATYTQIVGGQSVGCCGGVSSWGQRTAFVRCQRVYCLDVICPVDL